MMETILAIDTAKNALKYLKDLNPFFLGVCVCIIKSQTEYEKF